ncbi:MAG: hypothetical protein MJZ85_06615 [Bacteroidales bacterium]|nr:hypothetical protein [Bacteroidales bacterium]
MDKLKLRLQLFAEGGEGGGGTGEAAPAAAAPDAGEARLRELGVPEDLLQKRARRGNRAQAPAPTTTAEPKSEEPAKQDAAAKPAEQKRMTWDEIMADPEYNARMQETVQARLRQSKGAEERMKALTPAIEVLARHYGMDADQLDAGALAKAITDDDSYYEDKALEMGVSVETAKRIDQSDREAKRQRQAAEQSAQAQKIQAHLDKLQSQAAELKKIFPNFSLTEELKNPAFVRLTAPNSVLSLEDAYYAVHRKEIQQASMQAAAQRTATQISNSIQSGRSRPVENGTSGTAPSVTSFDYSKASKEQRDDLKRRIREAAARGEKIYPGQ